MIDTRLLHDSPKARLLLTENETHGRHVAKILNEDFPSTQKLRRFGREYELLKGTHIEGVRRVYGKGKVGDHHAIFMEYVEGVTLREYLQRAAGPGLEQQLTIARGLLGAIARLHDEGIIHKDVTPSNIIVDGAGERVTLIDFGIASRFTLKSQHLGNPRQLEGTLAYISPEQTGRMNRVVDYRTDIYSAGIVLYELVAGRTPFDADDPMELVHAHIASAPPLIQDLLPAGQVQSLTLEAIILKMIAKNAEDRYQSARGVLHDLDRCARELAEHGRIAPFEIATADHSGKFQLVQKLYGRDREIARLLEAYERSGSGELEMVLVAGFSGTGKSSLVKEIHKLVTEKRGYFVEGKFDQFQRSVPYFALIQAFRGLLKLLLSEEEWRLDRYRREIREAVGEEGGVLTEVLPELELVIGEQPPVVEVGGADAQNRFNYVFRRFVQALCGPENPLAVFIDDLQWADSASLDLMRVLLTDPDSSYFLCIGAYRDNEVGPAHPLRDLVRHLEEQEVPVTEIGLDNLTAGQVNDLIADSLQLPVERTRPLAELVVEKTGGNAYFVTQFLRSLYEAGLIEYDAEARGWRWEVARIREQELPDDVVALMGGKIRRMPEPTRRVLKLAACIGASFQTDNVARIAGEEEEALLRALRPALAEGLIYQQGEGFRFSHDRVQQAVYTLIPQEERVGLHVSIGRLLLERLSEEELEERIFDVVNQLNWGIDRMTDDASRRQLADLNLAAARRAKEASAFQPAYEYVTTGIGLLPSEHWRSDYERSVDLFTEAVETAFLTSRFGEMNDFIDRLLENARGLEETIRPLETRVHALKAQNRLPDALAAGLALLGKLGEKFPKDPGQLAVMPDLARTALMLRGKSNDDLLALPEMTDPIKRTAVRVLAGTAPPAYWSNPAVFPFLIFRMVQHSIRYGNFEVSAFAYATYGVIMVGALNRPKIGYRFGQLGLALLNKYHAKEWIAQIYTSVYALINIWNEHVATTLKPLRESYHVGLETGAIEFGCINANLYCIHAFLIGKPLRKLEEETRDFSASFADFNQDTNLTYNETFRQAMLNFLGQSAVSPTVLTGAALNEEEFLARCRENGNRMSIFQVYVCKMMLGNYFGDYRMAWECAELARPLLDSVLAKLEGSTFFFHAGIAAARLAAEDGSSRDKLLASSRKDYKKMKSWAKAAPENFLHKYELMRAEYARAKRRYREAAKFYDLAIQHASEHRYINEEALAGELAGRFQLEAGRQRLAQFYLRSAAQLYREWQAGAKLEQLTEEFPELVAGMWSRSTEAYTISRGTGGASLTTTVAMGEAIDLTTVLRASSIISGEIVLDKLLRTLLDLLLTNLGGTKGVLLLEEDHLLRVKAEATAGAAVTAENHDQALRGSKLVPESIITYVKRTKQQLLIDRATADDRFDHDPYVMEHRPLSVFCFPILHKGNFVGVIYSENTLSEAAFTEESTGLVDILSGQIAISIENARLYENLEDKVKERTALLAAEKEKSDELLLNILPAQTADELKRNGKARPRRYENVTVMFTDFVGFTRISEHMDPTELVNEIDGYFGAFDRIIDKWGLEKIKTIGDAYMCVGGLPDPAPDHAERVLRAALDIRQYMWKDKQDKEAAGKPSFAIRIGVHSGPVVAGVVGLRKFAYDIWGDTVNIASRAETNCAPWHINVTDTTYALSQALWDFEPRGKIEVKNRGMIGMHYLNQPLERLSTSE